jgi:hypothetical protein
LNTIFDQTKEHLIAFVKAPSSPSSHGIWLAYDPGNRHLTSTNSFQDFGSPLIGWRNSSWFVLEMGDLFLSKVKSTKEITAAT